MMHGHSTQQLGKHHRGRRAYLKGAAAEEAVERWYAARGGALLETRWRGAGGEIDLIFQDQSVIVFCEVKAASTTDEAIARLRPAQMARIHAAAAEYLALTPDGQLSDVRFDLAVLDEKGEVSVFENAFGHF